MKLLLLFSLPLFSFILSCGDNKTEPVNGAKLILQKSEIDFGTVSKSKTPQLIDSIQITNTGSHRLVIRRITPSCDCVSISGEFPDSIPPKENKTYIVKMDISLEENETTKKIFIRSNDKNQLEIIPVKANIHP